MEMVRFVLCCGMLRLTEIMVLRFSLPVLNGAVLGNPVLKDENLQSSML